MALREHPDTSAEASSAEAAGAPAETEVVRLRDGSSVSIRAVTRMDEPALRSFLEGLRLDARRMRFFSAAADLAFAAHLGAAADAQHYGLIAHDEVGVVVGHATYVTLDETRAEVAVEVADHLHDRGLGTILIERLAIIAERRGITDFVAEVLYENRGMLDALRDGFDARVVRRDGPEESVEFLTSSWRRARERFGPGTAHARATTDSRSSSRASGWAA